MADHPDLVTTSAGSWMQTNSSPWARPSAPNSSAYSAQWVRAQRVCRTGLRQRMLGRNDVWCWYGKIETGQQNADRSIHAKRCRTVARRTAPRSTDPARPTASHHIAA